MTTWRDAEIEVVDGVPMCHGQIELTNDKGELLANIMWFYEGGPFYSHAVDLSEPDVMRRIGPVSTLDGAKAACERAVAGGIPDLNKRAGYDR